MRWLFVLSVLCICGCDNVSNALFVKPQKGGNVVSPVVSGFDAVAAADEVAKQAEASNDAASEDANVVVRGMLDFAEQRKSLPEPFIQAVRSAVPALGDKEKPRDLTVDEVKAIRAVRI